MTTYNYAITSLTDKRNVSPWAVILGCNFKKVPSNIYTWNVPKTLYVFLGIHLIIPTVVIPFVYTQIILSVRNSSANAE